MRDSKQEEALIRHFFLPGRQERALAQLVSQRKRSQFLNRLTGLGFDYLDERFAIPLAEETQNIETIYTYLKTHGAPKTCYIISQLKEIDCWTLPLRDALVKIFQSGGGTLLSCIPGRLAYYMGADSSSRYLLMRTD